MGIEKFKKQPKSVLGKSFLTKRGMITALNLCQAEAAFGLYHPLL